MENYEINGNLKAEENYAIFSSCIGMVMKAFRECFGEEVMNKIDLYIDNATQSSGYTPIITVILEKYIIIKLGISDFTKKEKTVYQFSHELCHYVFYSIKGLNKEKAGVIEENICTAMALIMINKFFPESSESWNKYVSSLKNENYNKGTKIAEENNFDINKLKEKIYDMCSQ